MNDEIVLFESYYADITTFIKSETFAGRWEPFKYCKRVSVKAGLLILFMDDSEHFAFAIPIGAVEQIFFSREKDEEDDEEDDEEEAEQ